MATLKVRVLGKGLIPRGGGIAPRKEPITADLTLIQTMMSTAGLAPFEYVNPETGKALPLTRENLKRVWDKWSKYTGEKALVIEEEENGDGPQEPAVYDCAVCKAKFSYENDKTPAEGDELLCPACEAFKKTQTGTPPATPATPTTPAAAPANPYLVIKEENGTYTSTGVTMEQLVNGTAKAKADWLVHKGGDVYEPVAEQYIEAPTPEEKRCDKCGDVVLEIDGEPGKFNCTNPACEYNKKADEPPAGDKDPNEGKKPGDPGYQFQPRNKDNDSGSGNRGSGKNARDNK